MGIYNGVGVEKEEWVLQCDHCKLAFRQCGCCGMQAQVMHSLEVPGNVV